LEIPVGVVVVVEVEVDEVVVTVTERVSEVVVDMIVVVTVSVDVVGLVRISILILIVKREGNVRSCDGAYYIFVNVANGNILHRLFLESSTVERYKVNRTIKRTD
jgi:hypothetical protein